MRVRQTRRSRWIERLAHPARLSIGSFLLMIALGTVLLSFPAAREGPDSAPLSVALFTSTSAVCVTGLVVVDTPGYWTTFGETVVMVLMQIGGFGVMTLASVLSLIAFRRLALRHRLVAQRETRSFGLAELRQVLLGVLIFTAFFETILFVVLFTRLTTTYGVDVPRAAYEALFHAVSAFNNAGFSLYSDSLERFVADAWVMLPVALTIIAGGIGFPVLTELRRCPTRPKQWSIHTKLTIGTTIVLLVAGTVGIAFLEWTNPATLGEFTTNGKLLPSFFHSVTSRTAGFDAFGVADMEETSWLLTCVLMFIGGGSAGTAGGIKVTTFALLGFMMWAEAQGEPYVNVWARRVPGGAQRQALTVALLAIGAVVLGTLIIMSLGSFPLGDAMFESFSAFGTVGLSTGITGELSAGGRLVVMVLMFAGRLGPITLATALALRTRERKYKHPKEQPIIG
ncbi:MAG TPA: potassium transporter TrkG [Actinomycetota bacterium]|nr:potassium transporter TrkG [Actinomycetota bacterium]